MIMIINNPGHNLIEIARNEAGHGRCFAGLLKRYFG